MKKVFEIFLSKDFIIFLCIGVINTVVGLIIAFVSYNLCQFNYWISTFLDYFLTSILSYFLNKKYTFHYEGIDRKSIVRFSINIIVCYIIAFSIAKPLTTFVLCLNGLSNKMIDNIAMLVGTALFTVVNYLGQKLFAFKK